MVMNFFTVRLLVPTTAYGLAEFTYARHWGLFRQMTLPYWLEFSLAIGLMDLAIYWQHVAAHAMPLLWRVHRVHHADLDLDVTSGIRFHPAEIVLSMWWKLIVILLLGPLPVAVVAFEIVLNASAMFNHSNFAIPDRLDTWLRCFIVTPDMHRVHHSVVREEMNSNFGFLLPWWDRLFRTYSKAPNSGQTEMTIGLNEWRRASDVQPIAHLLLLPVRADVAPVMSEPREAKPVIESAHHTPE
jgi:sterol desaturase/sphingolipid hydroxylase (fatty acid hydroxylase superfamily)